MIRMTLTAAMLCGSLLIVGCGGDARQAQTEPANTDWLLTSMPENPRGVGEIKASAKEGDVVTMRGKIGGRPDPLGEERAVFVIMDSSIPTCADKDDDHCSTPWDYCCEPREVINASNATVMIVGADGKPIATDLRRYDIKPMTEVIVIGTVAERPSESVLTLRASAIYRVPE